MNKNIIGGWKYINDYTGIFFTDETDLREALYKMINNIYRFIPRQWFKDNYGKRRSGKKLLEFLKIYYEDVDLSNVKHVTII